jgi:intein/homing endonuclease
MVEVSYMSEYKKAMLFGFMLGDGWISKFGDKSVHLQAGFSGDEKSLQYAKDDLIELFGCIGKARINTRQTESAAYGIKGTTSSFVINTAVTRSFIEMGMPTGRRTEINYLLPEWIINGDESVLRGFLSGLYAAEGFTPSMQKNDKTLKPMGFNITKRFSLADNFQEFLQQLSDILGRLGIEHSMSLRETYTCDRNIKATISFGNSSENILRTCHVLDIRYCLYKQHEVRHVKAYYELKQETIDKLKLAYDEALQYKLSAKEISHKYDITVRQVQCWRERKTGIRIPNAFPMYSQFKASCCSL